VTPSPPDLSFNNYSLNNYRVYINKVKSFDLDQSQTPSQDDGPIQTAMHNTKTNTNNDWKSKMKYIDTD
jgi:hypothetical protein